MEINNVNWRNWKLWKLWKLWKHRWNIFNIKKLICNIEYFFNSNCDLTDIMKCLICYEGVEGCHALRSKRKELSIWHSNCKRSILFLSVMTSLMYAPPLNTFQKNEGEIFILFQESNLIFYNAKWYIYVYRIPMLGFQFSLKLPIVYEVGPKNSEIYFLRIL